MRTPLLRVVITGALLAVLGTATSLAAPPPPLKTPPRFVDNGDGTVTDNQTALMWEKKTNTNVNDTYTWSLSGGPPDGTLFSSFLAAMQCVVTTDGTCGLAGHYDWRIPNAAELQTIVDCSKPNCIDPIFGPTNLFYWSASTYAPNDVLAWFVKFTDGTGAAAPKTIVANYARAVRGGK